MGAARHLTIDRHSAVIRKQLDWVVEAADRIFADAFEIEIAFDEVGERAGQQHRSAQLFGEGFETLARLLETGIVLTLISSLPASLILAPAPLGLPNLRRLFDRKSRSLGPEGAVQSTPFFGGSQLTDWAAKLSL